MNSARILPTLAAAVAIVVVAAAILTLGQEVGNGITSVATEPALPAQPQPTTATTTTPPATTTTTVASTTTTSTLPATTSVGPVAPRLDPATLRPGNARPQVLALQRRLHRLGYWLGAPDGTYGELTEQAVTAFQKVEGLPRDGVRRTGDEEGPRRRRAAHGPQLEWRSG